MKLDAILCPVDFSGPSRHAFAYAMALARWYRSRIIALHVAQPAMAVAYAGGSPADAETSGLDFRRLRQQIRRELPMADADGVLFTPDVTTGAPAEAIAAYAQSAKPDLIVMGTRGTSGLKHLMLGSVTEEVLRSATCPVLAIPPGAGSETVFPFRQVLCATDFSAASLAALRAAADLTQDARSEITVMHVVDEADENELFLARAYDVHRHPGEREAHARKSLDDFTVRTFAGRAPALRIGHGSADREILKTANELGADLIVMGVRGRNAVNTMLFGSTTNSVVRRAGCPVLTAHI